MLRPTFGVCLFSLLEMAFPTSVGGLLGRSFCTMLLGTWNVHVGFLLYHDATSQWMTSINDEEAVHYIVAFFVLHAILNTVALLVVAKLAKIMAAYKVGDIIAYDQGKGEEFGLIQGIGDGGQVPYCGV